jgi:hypothetical protein
MDLKQTTGNWDDGFNYNIDSNGLDTNTANWDDGFNRQHARDWHHLGAGLIRKHSVLAAGGVRLLTAGPHSRCHGEITSTRCKVVTVR